MQERFLVFTGRPNAGKSSIINEVVGLNIAIGKHHETTRRIIKYPLSGDLVLVDMPGFGKMMGASKCSENKINVQIIEFLVSKAQNIVLAVSILDISTFLEVTSRLEKKGVISVDVEMVKFLADILGEFPLVVVNKIDKINREALRLNLREFTYQIINSHPFAVRDQVFQASSKTVEGLGVLKSAIHTRLVAKGHETVTLK